MRTTLPSWKCEVYVDIEIPNELTEPLMIAAAEQEISVEEIVERAIRNYMERSEENAD